MKLIIWLILSARLLLSACYLQDCCVRKLFVATVHLHLKKIFTAMDVVFTIFFKIRRVGVDVVKKWDLSEFFRGSIHFDEISG